MQHLPATKTTNKNSSLMCNSRPCGDSQVTRHEKGSWWEKKHLAGQLIHISASSKVLIFQAIVRGLVSYCWWQPEIRKTHQLRLVVYPTRVLAPSQVVSGRISSFPPLTQLPPGLTHFGSLEVMPRTEPKVHTTTQGGENPVPAILSLLSFLGVLFPFMSSKFSTKIPLKLFPNKNHAKKFANLEFLERLQLCHNLQQIRSRQFSP